MYIGIEFNTRDKIWLLNEQRYMYKQDIRTRIRSQGKEITRRSSEEVSRKIEYFSYYDTFSFF